jgi:hypothetical protein
LGDAHEVEIHTMLSGKRRTFASCLDQSVS